MRILCLLFVIGIYCVASQDTQDDEVKAALLILDPQYCTLPGGAAAVKGGDQVVMAVNDIRTTYDSKFAKVVLTMEWKCADHVSFASSHVGKNSGDVIDLHYNAHGQLCETEITQTSYTVPCPNGDPQSKGKMVKQKLFPDSCIAASPEAELSSLLLVKPSDTVILKSSKCSTSTDSAFRDNTHFNMTALEASLESAEVNTLLIVGVGDENIGATALDATIFSYNTYVISDATKGLTSTYAVALAQHGVQFISSGDIPSALGLVEPEKKPSARVGVVIIVCVASLISLATIVAYVSYMKYFRKNKSGNFEKVVVADQSEPIVPPDDSDDSDDSESEEGDIEDELKQLETKDGEEGSSSSSSSEEEEEKLEA